MDKSAYKILLVDDEEEFRSQCTSLLEREGYHVESVTDGISAINTIQESAYDLILLDYSLPKINGMEVLHFVKEHYPDTEIIMVTGVNDVNIALESMKGGAFFHVMKPFLYEDFLLIVARALEHRDLRQANTVMQSELTNIAGKAEPIGANKAFVDLLDLAQRVAQTETNVLIQGASGTGKELIANYVYRNSQRSTKPFVAINCAAIPDTLLESELFGYEKGAFTDARMQKQGLVELAHKGVLFLDEVGDINLMIQPKLLRFIQTGEFRRVGGNTVHRSEVRIISATNKDLREEVRKERFREDLFYRLNVVTLTVPALNDRKEDIPLLVENFLKLKFLKRSRKVISPEAMELLMEYDWPGNVRELENVVESSIILCRGDVIQPQDIMLPQKSHRPGNHHHERYCDLKPHLPLREVEKRHISTVLNSVSWDKKTAAKILGISLKTLYTKITGYHLSPN